MPNVENVSDSMSRTTGVKGNYVSVYDGKNFWYVHIMDYKRVVYDENQQLNTNEEVRDMIDKQLISYIKEF